MRRHRLTAIAVTALVLAGAGCSSSKSKTSSSAKDAAGSFAGASAPAAAGGDGSADGFGAGQNLQGGPGAESASAAASSTGASAAPERTATGKAGSKPIVRGRVATSPEDIIKNAAISIEVKDVDKARNDAVGQAKGLGADLASEARAGTGEKKSATLVFRVPPTEFDNLVTAVGELGEVTGSKTTTEDVTGQVADIKGRLGAAQDSAVKIRALIQRAEKITDIIALEREYESRDADIQSMASQLAALKDRADRSTVTLSIGPATEKPKPPAKPKKRQTGFVGGLKSGWDAFSATTVVLATAAGALLPFLVVVATGLIGWWIVRRRRGALVPSAPETATPYATPAA